MKPAGLFAIFLVAVLLAVAVITEAQQPKKIPRIAWVGAARMPSPRIEAFRQGLRELGYVEGKNIYSFFSSGKVMAKQKNSSVISVG